MQWQGEGETRYLTASPEKALVDKVWTDKRFTPATPRDFHGYLLEELRMDETLLDALDRKRIAEVAAAFASSKIDLLARYLRQRRARALVRGVLPENRGADRNAIIAANP